jgi:transposase
LTASQRSLRPDLIDGTASASRFTCEHVVATYAGVAQIEIASGAHSRHRRSRAGNRRLKSAIHLIAVTQVQMRNSIRRAYFDKRIAAGKSRNEAMRCLKRRLASRIWRVMITDERRFTDNLSGTEGAAWQTQRTPEVPRFRRSSRAPRGI